MEIADYFKPVIKKIFTNSSSLKIKYYDTVKESSSLDDFMINEERDFVWYQGRAKTVYVPNDITRIPSLAFNNCLSLMHIVLHKGVKSIGFSAFKNCASLVNINLPEDLLEIEFGMLRECISLEKIVIPSRVSSIQHSAFEGCEALSTVILNDGLRYIENEAFSGCVNLNMIIISKSVEFIDSQAFSKCPNLKSVTILNADTKIYNKSFDADTLKEIYISNPQNLPKKFKLCAVRGFLTKYIKDELQEDVIQNYIKRYLWYLLDPSSDLFLNLCKFVTDKKILPHSKAVELLGMPISGRARATKIGNCAFFCCGSLTNNMNPVRIMSLSEKAIYLKGIKTLLHIDSLWFYSN